VKRGIVASGRCECGGVRYEIHGADPLRNVIACHCGQCRRTSGHFVAATSVRNDALVLVEAETLRWYRSSKAAERGFCNRCGGNLFWRETSGTATSIMAGTLDTPTGLRMERHIFVADKSDYYDIDDGLPQEQQW
jgi:hypothetical protein